MAAGPFDLLDGLHSTLRVASVHDHLETVGGQLQGHRTADTGRRPGHKRPRREDVGHVLAPLLGSYAFMPPSTVRFAPVMYDASGPATNATSAATSSTCP